MLDPAALDRYAAADRAFTAAMIGRLEELASIALSGPEMKLALIVEPAFAARMETAFAAAQEG